MHQYAATMPPRERTLVWSVAFTLAMLLAVGVTALVEWLDLPVWLQALAPGSSAVGAFQGTLELYNEHGWRHRALRWVHRNVLPDLAGTYRVEIRPSVGRPEARPTEGTAHLKQSRTKLSVAMTFGGSRSRSIMANVHTALDADRGVTYQYQSTAVAPSKQDRTDVAGTARLWLQPDGTLAGDYHTGPPRRGNGSLRLTPATESPTPVSVDA